MNRLATFVLLVLASLAGVLRSDAQPVTTIYSFINGPATPMAGLTPGNDGNFYGTTESGGLNNEGTAFKMTTNGNTTTLVNFGATFGSPTYPAANLTLGPDGNFYGTTSQGGTNTSGFNATGTVFKMMTNGTVTMLASFNGVNGGIPLAGLALGADGNFYGTTEFGGTNGDGTVFRVTTNGTLTTLVTFNGTNGMSPFAGLVAGPGGNLYGTTRYGGTNGNFGTVFAVTTNGAFTPLFDFSGTNGAAPYGALIVGPDGNLYGTTSDGSYLNGASDGGTVFEMTTNGVLTTLVTMTGFFGSIEGTSNGVSPHAGLTLGLDGNFYGTTYAGGTNGSGTVFQVTTNGTLAKLARAGISYQLVTNSFGVEFWVTNGGGLITEVFNGTLTTLYSFTTQTNFVNADGAQPQAGLTLGPDGNFYGTASGGGTNGYGTTFKVTTNGTFTALASFSGNHGDYPMDALMPGPDGSLYGTANSGGTLGFGTVFKLTTNGALTTLVNFDRANSGANPQAGLIIGPGGNFYGTVVGGGTNLLQTGPSSYLAESFGTVFELTTNGIFTTLAYFNGTDGANPFGGLAAGTDGNLYGTTTYGGISNNGTVFQMTTNGTLTTLTNFTGLNGANPFAGLTLGLDGNFYGTSEAGGISNQGTVFQVTTSGALTTLANFTGTNGANPNAGLLLGPDGSFYGTAFEGGTHNNAGTVFKVTTGGTLTTLVNFAVTNGEFPVGGLALGPDGNFYGTTELGGVLPSSGTVFKLATNGTLTTLFNFVFSSTSPNGNYPFASLTLVTNGNFIHFYGTTYEGPNGPSGGGGTLFRVNPTTAYAVAENSTNTFFPLTNDVLWTTGGTLSLVNAAATNGTGQITGSGIVFKPAANFIGTATINYSVTNNAGGTNSSFITVLVTNMPPVANPDFYTVAGNSSANVLSPMTNDVLETSGGVLGLVSISATNGTAIISGTNVLFTPTASFTGTATIGYTITDNISGTNTSLITVTVVNASADLSLSASAAPQPVGVNSNLVYSISVTNLGPSTASGVTVSNQVPPGVTFVSATGGATPASGVLFLNLGTLTNGAVTNVQVTVQPTAAGTLTNLFQVFANETDPLLTNNSASVISTVTNAPVVGTPVPGTPIAWTNPGGSIVVTYTIGFAGNSVPVQIGDGTNAASTGQAGDLVLLLTNDGVTASTNWAAVVRFYNPTDPTGSNGLAATYEQTFFATNFGGSGFNGHQLFPVVYYTPVGTIGTNTTGQLTILNFNATYVQFGPIGTIIPGQEDLGTVFLFIATSGVDITSPTNGQVVSNAALTVTGTTTNFLFIGNNLKYAITNVFVQLNGGAWTNATSVNGWTNWSANVTLTPGSNTVSAYSEDGYGSVSPTNSVTFDYATGTGADLSLSVTESPNPVETSSNLVYSITVSNAGPATATDVTVSNAIFTTNSYLGFVSATGGSTPANGILLMNLGSLAAGATTTAQISATALVNTNVFLEFFTNTFQVSGDQSDPNPANNSATVTFNSPGPNLSTTSTRTVATSLTANASQQATNYSTQLIAVMPGGAVVYNQTFAAPFSNGAIQAAVALAAADLTNAGASGFTGPTDTSTLQTFQGSSQVNATNPVGTNIAFTFTSYVGPTNIFVGTAQTYLLTLPFGFVDIDTLITTDLTNLMTTTITSNYLNSSVYVLTGIVSQADLSLSVTESPNPVNVAVSNLLTYTFIVSNAGPATATDVTVSNQIFTQSSGFVFNSATGGSTPTNGILLMNLGTLVPGATNVAQLTAYLVRGGPASFYTNTFQVYADQTDPNTTNNFATTVFQGTGGNTTQFTTSTAEYDSNSTTTVSQQLTNYTTELIAKLPNGTVVYDQTFNVAFSNAAVQAAIATAVLDLTNAGSSAYTGPAQTGFSQTTNNSSVTVTVNTNINVIVGTKQWVGPVTFPAGNFGVVTGYSFDPVVTNYAIPTGGNPQPFTLTSGQTDFDTMILSLVDFFLTTTNTATYTNSAVYVMTGIAAQADLSLSASAAPEPVVVGSNLVYTIAITNRGPSAATGVVVSNRLPANETFVSATGGSTPSGGILLVNLGSLAAGATNSAQIVVQPTSAGKLTNLFQVFANETDPVLTNNSATVVSTVTNPPPSPVDVALSLTSAPNPVAVGAPLTYSLTVTNNSGTTATGVGVSNTLPANVTLFSLLPSQGSASNSAGIVKFAVGSLPNGTAANLAIVVIPNTAGLLTNKAVAFSSQPDSQPTNNSVTNVTTAVSVPITNLVLTVLTPATVNPQTGLFQQRVEVSNGGPSTPASVRLLVYGLAANAQLYNASGTTNGTPFVQSASPLGIGSNVVFLLEFYVPTRVAPTNLTFVVQAGPVVIPPVVSGTIVNISRTVVLSDGSVLVEFGAVPGQVYAIQYGNDLATWLTAVPAITAPGTRVQWIDSGPPKTNISPAQQPTRYYRVILLSAQ